MFTLASNPCQGFSVIVCVAVDNDTGDKFIAGDNNISD